MTATVPLIIVTVPGRSVAEVRPQLAEAHAGGADLAEVRLDRWSPSDRSNVAQLFPTPLPLVVTLRSRAEGGEGPDDPEERASSLEAAAGLPFHWIDLEEARDSAVAERLALAPTLGRILSTHFLEGTPTAEVADRMALRTPARTIQKLVLPATIGTLFGEVLPLLSAPAAGLRVLLTTGPSGALLRAWSKRFRFPIVYASLPEPGPAATSASVESSQIPADRLRYFFSADDAPLFAVTGHPIAHSLSPYLHSRWMKAGHFPGLYLSLDMRTESEFVEALAPLAAGGFRGLNVTHPWKSAALEAATRVGRGAELCGAANCLTFRGEEIEAENTDLVAVLRRMDELRRAGDWDGGELAVIGTGGAAAATLAAARELGVPARVYARDAAAAKAISKRFGAAPGEDARPVSLVVHATDVGRGDTGPLDAPLARLIGPSTVVLDWVYTPVDPYVRVATEAAGGRYEDGWRLLVYQAAASFGIWWGAEPGAEELTATIAEGPCTA